MILILKVKKKSRYKIKLKVSYFKQDEQHAFNLNYLLKGPSENLDRNISA